MVLVVVVVVIYYYYNSLNYSQLLVGLARERFWPKSFMNCLGRSDVRLKVIGTWSLARPAFYFR